jgi:hypothetical protein
MPAGRHPNGFNHELSEPELEVRFVDGVVTLSQIERNSPTAANAEV